MKMSKPGMSSIKSWKTKNIALHFVNKVHCNVFCFSTFLKACPDMSMVERDIAIASSKQLLSFANDELFIVNKNCKMEEVTEEEIFKIFIK